MMKTVQTTFFELLEVLDLVSTEVNRNNLLSSITPCLPTVFAVSHHSIFLAVSPKIQFNRKKLKGLWGIL
jgi:hypothetical protein